MEPLPKIPSPPSLRWREFRYTFMPGAVFVVAAVLAVVIWSRRVAAPSMMGEVESIASTVAAPKDGVIVQLGCDLFDEVESGQAVVIVETTDPESVKVALASISAELKMLRARMKQDQQRILQDYEQLRLNWLRERVSLATAKVNLRYAENELQRVTKLYEESLVSSEAYEQALTEAEARQAEVDEQTRLVEQISTGLEQNSPTGYQEFSSAITKELTEAVEANERELELAYNNQITLSAPVRGRVSQIHFHEGEFVAGGEPILTLVASRPSRIVGLLRQPVGVVPQAGDLVEIRSRSQQRQTGVGTVLKVGGHYEYFRSGTLPRDTPPDRAVDPLGIPVLISIPTNLTLLPGESVDLALQP